MAASSQAVRFGAPPASVSLKASQSFAAGRRKKIRSFSPATFASEKILFRLQVWNLCAAGTQIMRAADCNPFAEKTEGFFGSLERDARQGVPLFVSSASFTPPERRTLSPSHKIVNGYAAPSVHFTAFRCKMQSPPLDRTENFGYNRRYTRFGGIYAVRR